MPGSRQGIPSAWHRAQVLPYRLTAVQTCKMHTETPAGGFGHLYSKLAVQARTASDMALCPCSSMCQVDRPAEHQGKRSRCFASECRLPDGGLCPCSLVQTRSGAEQARSDAELEADSLHRRLQLLSGDMVGATNTLRSLSEDLSQAQWTANHNLCLVNQLWECCRRADKRVRKLVGVIVPDKLNRPCSRGEVL